MSATETMTPLRVCALIARQLRVHLAEISRELAPEQATRLAVLLDAAARNVACGLIGVTVVDDSDTAMLAERERRKEQP